MLILTGQEVIDYMPVIEEYSGYDRDNTVFDNYILAIATKLLNELQIAGIDGNTTEIQDSELFKELSLKMIVCKYYNETSYNIEEDERFIDFLCDSAKDYLKAFIKSVNDNGIVDTFDGTITNSFSG